jgi:hypothetical protein
VVVEGVGMATMRWRVKQGVMWWKQGLCFPPGTIPLAKKEGEEVAA